MLDYDFFGRDSIEVAEDLLGKVLVRKFPDGHVIKARIVETECYRGTFDKGSHAYGGRRTNRNESMYGPAGIVYVYFTYGMYHMLNIVTGEEDYPDAVLIRGLEPISDSNIFAQKRFGKDYDELSSYQKKNMLNGPGKLTKALEIDKSFDGIMLGEYIYIEDDGFKEFTVKKTPRIGIDYAEEWKDEPYRFVATCIIGGRRI